MIARTVKPSWPRAIVSLTLISLVVLIALVSRGDTAHASTFNPASSLTFANTTPGATSDIVTSFDLHDGRVSKIRSKGVLEFSFSGETINSKLKVRIQNFGVHTDDFGIYVAIVSPAGCSTSLGTQTNWVEFAIATAGNPSNIPLGDPDHVVDLAPQDPDPTFLGGGIKVQGFLDWTCLSSADGANFLAKFIVDHGFDDEPSCDTPAKIYGGACEAAIADDDDNDGNNILTRPLPIVEFP